MNHAGTAAAAQDTWVLFAGLAAVLLAASLAAALLKRRVARGRPHALVDHLRARTRAWWAMVALIGIAFAFGKGGVVLLFLFVSFFALREFMTLAYTRTADHAAVAVAFYVGLPVQYLLVWIEWQGLWTVFIPVYAFLLLPILAALRGDTKRFLERTSKVQWGLMVCVYCISHVPALLLLQARGFEGRNLLLIAFLMVVVQGGDELQYLADRLAGRRLVAPALSDSLTREGLAGGVLGAAALGAALSWLTPFSPLQAAGMACVISVMGLLGGLVMTAIKRDRGVEDWGGTVEGRGGMLDRVDSVVFAAPVFFHLTRFGWSA